MTKKCKFTTILCLFIVSVFAMIGAVDSIIVKAEGWTAKSGYTLSQDDDGNDLYTCVSEGSSVVEYFADDFTKYNTVSAKFSYQQSCAGDAQVDIQINSGNNYYLLCILTANETKQAVFKYGDNIIASKDLDPDFYGTIQPDVWTEMKLVLMDDYYAGYINGKLCFKGTLDGEFPWTRALICSWKAHNKVKDLALSVSEKDATDVPTPPAGEGSWKNNALYTAGENGAYKCTSEGSAVVEYKGDFGDNNAVSAKFNYQKTFAWDAQVGIQINVQTGYYYFHVLTEAEQKVAALKYGDSTIKSVNLDEQTYGDVSGASDIDIKFILQGGYYAGYINGVKCFDGIVSSNIKWQRALVCSWKCANEIKDPALSKEEVETPDTPVTGDWEADGSWTISDEDGEAVYTTTAYASIIEYTGSREGMNTIEADIRYVRAYNGEGFCALQINTSKGYYLLDVAPNTPEDPVSRVKKGDNLLLRQVLTGTGFGETSSGNWIHMKVVLDENYLVAYLNGRLMYKMFDTRGETLWTRALLCTWYDACSVKNLKVSHTELDYENVGYLDLEFKNEAAVSTFKAENASMSYEDGAMKIALENGSGEITSPEINETRGQRYSALLTMQNTLLVRMKATGNITGVTVKYVTSDDGEYSEQKSKYFAVNLTDGYAPYYFNLSDTAGMTGYLRGFKIIFEGDATGNATEVYIDAITFEREDPVYPFAGEVTECKGDPDTNKVTVKGKVDKKYAGKRVHIYRSSVENYLESLDFKGLVLENSAKVAANGEFTVNFSAIDSDGRLKLAYLFIAAVENIKVAPSFKIENYADFSEKVTRFEISGPTVYADQFGAKGDSYTDDTEAIQKAIDYIKSQGGGKLILRGDTSTPYGRRYVATHLRLADNMEFEIEKGAILWQSSRECDYHYEKYEKNSLYDTSKPTYGHDVGINVIRWCHAGSTVNYPLLFLNKLQNVRLTGEGTIRMTDIGAEEPDANYFLGNPQKNVGCTNRIHILPICVYNCENIDITNLTIARSNIWHMYMSFSKNIYVANILEKEVGCATSDGFTVTSDKDVIIDRVMTYTSDDSIGLCTCYDDPRGFLFRPSRPGEDNACENLVLRNSYFWGGFGISFIPWGSGAPNSYLEELRDIEIHDCVLGGEKSVGCWTDDPFYGNSKYDSYDQSEDNDHTPVKNVHFYNNVYLKGFEYYLGNVKLKVTNLVVEDNDDPSARSQTNFKLGSFDKVVRTGANFPDESSYVTGLSYWSFSGDKQNFGTEKIADGMGYSGYIKHNGELFQGLYLEQGTYKFTIKTLDSTGKLSLFVRDSFGMLLHTGKAQISDDFTTSTLVFTVNYAGNYRIGAMFDGDESQIAYIDDANVEYTGTSEVSGEYFKDKFDGKNLLINFDVCKLDGGKLLLKSDLRRNNIESKGSYKRFDMAMKFNVVNSGNRGAIVLTFKNYAGFSTDFNINLANYTSGEHRLTTKYSGGKLAVYIDGMLVEERANESRNALFFTINTSGAEVAVSTFEIAEPNSLNVDKAMYKVTLENKDNINVSLNSGDEYADGSTVNFIVDGNAEVYVNGAKTESVDGIYTFTVNGNTTVTVKAVKKSGCKSSVGGTVQLAAIMMLVSVAIFVRKKKTKFDI